MTKTVTKNVLVEVDCMVVAGNVAAFTELSVFGLIQLGKASTCPSGSSHTGMTDATYGFVVEEVGIEMAWSTPLTLLNVGGPRNR